MRFRFLITVLSVGVLLGCTINGDFPQAKPTTGRLPQVAEVPEAEETVRGAEDPPIVKLKMGTRLRERKLSQADELPTGIVIPNTNLRSVPVTAALQAVLEGTEVSLSWDAGSFDSRLVTVTNLSGPLPTVVQKICASAKVFCSYRGGLLEIKDKETFIIDLPSIPTKAAASSAATNTMADTIGDLAGEKVKIDAQGGNLIYTTDVEGYERVRQYLDQLRHGRPLIVLQLYIWEVTLNGDNATGINWKSFSLDAVRNGMQEYALSSLTTGFTSLTSPGVSIGATLKGRVDAEAVLQFLKEQGQVQTISSPQLTFVSGSNADFRVGGKQRYISQVGQLTSSVAGTGSSSGGVGTNTVSTDSIDTGLTVVVGGSYEGGIISAILELTTQDVISLNPTNAGSGVTINLPETSERKVSTSIRVRPGDNLVMAGLVTSRDVNDREGVPLPFGAGQINSYSRDQLKNTELVILVKPSIVLFEEGLAEAADSYLSPSTQKVTASVGVSDAVMIDKDGTKILSLPSTQPQAALPLYNTESAVPASSFSETMRAYAPQAQDGAVVDRRLLQRGFSHAFDEMRGGGTSNWYQGW